MGVLFGTFGFCSECVGVPKNKISTSIHSPHTMTTARKTREQRNAERVVLRKSRKIPRVTKGLFTFDKAVEEVQARNFVVSSEAEHFWNQQTCSASSRKVRVLQHGSQKDVCLDNILKGSALSSKPTAEARKASNAKNSATHVALSNGQTHWMESAGINASMRVLDPHGQLEVRLLPDGLGADYLLRIAGSTEDAWVPVQMKTAEGHDGHVQFKVERKDGLPGGKYHGMVIIGAVLMKVDRKAAKKTMKVFGAIPEVEVTELFVYKSASDIPGAFLTAYPRRKL